MQLYGLCYDAFNTFSRNQVREQGKSSETTDREHISTQIVIHILHFIRQMLLSNNGYKIVGPQTVNF